MNCYTITKIEHKKPDRGEGKWFYHTSRGVLYLPNKNVGRVSRVDDNLANFVNAGNPIIKHLVTENFRIIEAANVCVDVVPYRNGEIYLIERKDGRGTAIPGGFIDEGETPMQAAVRELGEETEAEVDQYELYSLGDFVEGVDPREVNTWTFPFLAKVHDGVILGFGDDAIGGQWHPVASVENMTLAFPHHKEIIQLAIDQCQTTK